ncbi:MAG: hypothetical protein ABI273_12355 [Lacunisphaera sp.]
MEPPPLTATPSLATQRAKDEEHLRLLAIFHYVVAGLGALFACFPLIHVAVGLMLFYHRGIPSHGQQGAPPEWFGLLFVVVGGFFVLLGWTAAICTFISGRYLARRRKRLFSFVMAAILCMFMPFGTILGIFTLIVLSRESVQQLYVSAEKSP